MRAIINKIKFFQFILNHPLNKGEKVAAMLRYLRWQIGSRLVSGGVAVDYVNDSRLLVRPGMTGATCNIYAGLHEFEDMAFVLHCLRKEDVFVDIGANIGSYTVLAGGAVGAQCFSIEPIPATFERLKDNIHLNGMSDHITALNIGIGEKEGVLRFTSDLDTVNHVLSDDEANNTSFSEVPVHQLDDVLSEVEPVMIKIDVEGFETNVIKGAEAVLAKPSLLAVLMELNGSGDRYGFDENELHAKMLSYGFAPYEYCPLKREIISLNGKNNDSGNTLYLRNIEGVMQRIKNAPKYSIKSTCCEI